MADGRTGLTVGGRHTYRDFGLYMKSQYIGPPAVQTRYVDVPGKDGPVDLTDANGGPFYGTRECLWEFVTDAPYASRLGTLRELYNYLHGKRFEFVLDSDPEYTMSGRFFAEDPSDRPSATTLAVRADADPYRSAGDVVLYADAAGGATFLLPCGRKSVSPTFDTRWDTDIVYEGVTYRLPPGASVVRDIWLRHGTNSIYINSYPGGGSQTWNDIGSRGVTWRNFRASRVVEWRWGGAEPGEERRVYIRYEREDI